jgi:TonB family protein
VDKPIATQAELDKGLIGLKDRSGKKADDRVRIDIKPAGAGTGNEPVKTGTGFSPGYSDPEYPGGQQALSRFLSQNLVTPGNLEPGEKKIIKLRFKVDKDGFVTGFEIDRSGGLQYDSEVIRVCKKMQSWKPATQNGVAVPVSYVLPVTFIGAEQ